MTLEQAIEVLIDRYNSGVIRGRTDDEWRLATDTVIAALQGPQPDPETGLMPCGCGGHGIGYYVDTPYTDKGYYIVCTDCTIKVEGCPDAISAKETWNTALGYREETQ